MLTEWQVIHEQENTYDVEPPSHTFKYDQCLSREIFENGYK